jgi:hypothetical protein
VTVRERLEVMDGKLMRRFRITGSSTVWFAAPESVTGLEVPTGTREGAFYKLTGPAAQDFTVTHAIPPS